MPTGKVGAIAAAVEGAAEKAGANGAVEAVLASCTPGAVQVAALRTLSLLLAHPQVRRLHVPTLACCSSGGGRRSPCPVVTARLRSWCRLAIVSGVYMSTRNRI